MWVSFSRGKHVYDWGRALSYSVLDFVIVLVVLLCYLSIAGAALYWIILYLGAFVPHSSYCSSFISQLMLISYSCSKSYKYFATLLYSSTFGFMKDTFSPQVLQIFEDRHVSEWWKYRFSDWQERKHNTILISMITDRWVRTTRTTTPMFSSNIKRGIQHFLLINTTQWQHNSTIHNKRMITGLQQMSVNAGLGFSM